MKNIFKNKKFYVGIAATFAVVAGLYFALPASMSTSDAPEPGTADTASTEIEDSVIRVKPVINTIPAAGTGSTGETKPAVNVDDIPQVDNKPSVDQLKNVDTDKI